MALLWQIIYIALVIMVIIIIPSCIYYYEADDEWSCVNKLFLTLKCEKFKYAFCYLFATIIICVIIIVITYAFLSKVKYNCLIS